MGKQYKTISAKIAEFITAQKMLFLASCCGKEVNISPKGYDCFRVLDESTALYMDHPGSGNRLARDISGGGEVTVMFCSFEGAPKIIRLFCDGDLVEKSDPRFDGLKQEHFEQVPAENIRRLVWLNVYAVEDSCGFGVPYFSYTGERGELRDWIDKAKAGGKLEEYISSHSEPVKLR
ncbi:MAG: pyridoxamine 5'-phosphate oxidase family protein [Nitrospinota bacterium]|nr:pyridoxamine 5'-phosphate oxidase family protein [Nitrospinota bacterium]